MTPQDLLPHDLASGEPFVLRGVHVPATFTAFEGGAEIVTADIGIEQGRIAFVAPSLAETPSAWRDIRLDRMMVWPCFVEAHTHLDSTQIWARSPNPDGTFGSAASAIIADRETHWTPDDMRRRMDFGLRCAYAHGVRAMRTHLASQNEQIEQRWEIFSEVRAAWAGRIDLQAVPLISTDVLADDVWFARVLDVVRRHGGVLGGFAHVSPLVDASLERLFDAADKYGLALDFHADETDDATSDIVRRVATLADRRGGGMQVMVGHCCSLAVQDETEVDRTLDLMARAGLSVVSLPGCNLYLQARAPGRTPRWRGVTLLHEMAARDIPICIGGDNCRDPYNPYGDFNPLESFQDAVRIAHLDHPVGDWPRSVTTTPGALVSQAQAIVAGAPADLVLYRAKSYNELFVRHGAGRLVMRDGIFIDAPLPDFSELD
ncbi:cytosine deaminase [Sphingobium sp. B11D3B]|uniref:cytosine deaminase n=1 Tax=Sphingobium sp. B11D3B TaxID=2940575 RepID=UPI002226677C|nr:cytosine deaminase [Sphingobium sp. B11D3B]MCW2388945.1 cytosine deaminase [Sphingobium sp. B11D3B]